MPEKTSLVLNVKSDSIEKASDRLDKLTKVSKDNERATDALTRSKDSLAKAELESAKAEIKSATALVKSAKSSKELTAAKLKLTRAEVRAAKATKNLTESQLRQTKTEKAATEATKRNTRANDKNSKSHSKLAFQVGLVSSALLAIKGSVAAASELETLEISLVSVTGSAAAAKATLADLTNFTAKTPFQLEGVAAAAKQLITAKGSTQGLKEELKLLGDLSATVGVPIQELAAIYVKAFNKGKVQAEELNQISERGIPIIRLLAEEYGITSAEVFKLGEQGKISFTDLQKVLRKTGEEGGLAFGAMERQSETFNGSVSTLKDNIKLTAGAIGTLIIESAKLKEIAKGTAEILEAFRVGLELLQGTKLKESLEENVSVLQKYNDSTKSTAELVARELDARQKVKSLTEQREAAQLKHLENLKLYRESQGKFSAQEFDKSLKILKNLRDRQVLEVENQNVLIRKLNLHDQELRKQEETLQLSQRYRSEIEFINLKYQLAFGSSKELTEEDKRRLGFLVQQVDALSGQVKQYQNIAAAAKVAANLSDIVSSAAGKAFSSLESDLQTQEERIGSNFRKQISNIDAYSKALKEAGLTDEAELARIAQARNRAVSGRDKALESLKPKEAIKAASKGTPVTRGSRSPSPSGASGPSEFEILRSELLNSEAAIEASYLKRLDLVRNNTAAGSDLRAELTRKIESERDEETSAYRDNLINRSSIYERSLEDSLVKLQTFYDRRRQLIMENESLTENEKIALEERLNNEQAQTRKRIRQVRTSEELSAQAELLGGLSDLASQFGKKGAKVAKALAISQATINAYLGFSNALADPTPMPTPVRFALAGASLATGLANVISISSQSAGNYASGGILGGPSGSGDSVSFNGNRGEAIINFEQQRRLLNIANGAAVAGSGGNGNITIINQTSSEFGDVEQSRNSAGERILLIKEAVKQTKAEIANEADTGVGIVVPALQRNGLLRRRGSA